MGSNYWSLIKLKDLSIDGKGIYGLNAPAVPYNPKLFKYLRITDIKDDGTLDYENMTSVDDMSSYKYILKDNDIVFARTGNSTGRSYLYDKRDGTLVYAGYLIKFSLDEKKVNPKYVKYYTLTDDYKGWVNSFATGSTRNSINAKIYGDMEIKVPRREVQDRIVSILDCIENKIRYNNHIILVLESIAKALYKEWFVNFNFPDENGLPYKDNGGQFYETELGEIPIGWEVKYLSEITYFKNGINYNNDNVYNNDYRIINVKDITNSNYLASNTSLESIDIDSNSAEKYLVNHLDTIMARSANAGKVLLYLGNEQNTVYSGFSILIRSLNNNTAYYIFSFCQNIINYLVAYSNGTIFKNISQGVLKAIKLALPNQNILDKYNSIVSKIYKQIANKSTEIEKLNNLKNLLLNKLMSGQIDVDKLNIDWDKLDKTLKEVE